MSNSWAFLVVARFVALMWKLQSQKDDVESLKADLLTLKNQPKLTLHITQWLLRHAREGRSPPASLSYLAGCGATIGGTELLTDGDAAPEPTCSKCVVLWEEALRAGRERELAGPALNAPTYHVTKFLLGVLSDGTAPSKDGIGRAGCGAALGTQDVLAAGMDPPTCPKCATLLREATAVGLARVK